MADDRFNVVFRGDIVPGQLLPDVKARFAQLFKLEADRVDAYFTGKPVVLKKDCDRATADKFKAVLAQAGALVDVKSADESSARPPRPAVSAAASAASATTSAVPSAPVSAPVPTSTPTPAVAVVPSALPSAGASPVADPWSLSPRGSELLKPDERSAPAPVQVSIDHIAIVKRNPFAQDAEAPLEADRVVEPPSLDLSGLQLGRVGERLTEETVFEPLALDLSAFSLDAPGADLLREDETLPVMAVAVETDHLSMAPPGGELGQMALPPAPPPPSTEHLSLEK